jgi:hypothetical protein
MDGNVSGRPTTPWAVLLLLIAGTACPAQTGAPAPPAPAVNGSLTVEKGVRVLRLWGTPREMGQAHGHLLASEILDGLDAYVVHSPVVGGPRNYEQRVVPMVRRQMVFLPEYADELAGMLAGIRAALGDEARVPSLGRAVELIDLEVLNTYGDWYQFACSSFSAWGALTPDGETITARNFDFPPAPILEKSQLLIATSPSDPARKRWVNVAFPGVIGVISGMNEDGVGIFVHDVRRRKGADHETGVNARLVALRSAIETTGASDAPRKVHARLRELKTSMGNNVHVTSPYEPGQAPAAVIEYDGVEEQAGGADLRVPDEGASTVFCTNHYRLRCPPSGCRRYAKLDALLGGERKGSPRIDAAEARSIMSAIVQNALFSRTMHTVIFHPASRRFELMLSKDGKVAPASPPVSFTLDELLPARK